MPNLNFLMSVATILLLIWWFVYPGLREGWQQWRTNPPVIAMGVLFALHVVWLVNTQDWQYAAKDLRIKLPLLVLAFAIGGVKHDRRDIARVAFWLSVGIWVAMLTTVYNYLSFDGVPLDMRVFVGEISHIRLSLMMVVSIAAAIYFWPRMHLGFRTYSLITIASILLYLNFLQLATGFAVLLVLLLFTVILFIHRRWGRKSAWGMLGVVLLGVGALVYDSWDYYRNYFVSSDTIPSETTYTAEGNEYQFYPSFQVENGHHVHYYISEGELAAAWNERSTDSMSYDDPSDRDLIARVYRYLTAKGLKKDRAGVMALSERDIHNIESGYAAPVYAESSGLALRRHVILYSAHTYFHSGNASGLSFFQRIVYWKVAARLIAENFWTGTGTGDVKKTFKSAYDRFDINLEPRFRLRAHNQFLTLFVSFGVWGLIAFVGLFLIFAYHASTDYFRWAVILVLALSCMTEDTLETQAGVTFFSFFVALLGSKLPTRSRSK